MIVVDEIHMLADTHRGFLLEVILSKVIFALKNKVQIIGMSATLPNISDLSNWLDASLFSTEFRPVDLSIRACMNKKLYRIVGVKDIQACESSTKSGDSATNNRNGDYAVLAARSDSSTRRNNASVCKNTTSVYTTSKTVQNTTVPIVTSSNSSDSKYASVEMNTHTNTRTLNSVIAKIPDKIIDEITVEIPYKIPDSVITVDLTCDSVVTIEMDVEVEVEVECAESFAVQRRSARHRPICLIQTCDGSGVMESTSKLAHAQKNVLQSVVQTNQCNAHSNTLAVEHDNRMHYENEDENDVEMKDNVTAKNDNRNSNLMQMEKENENEKISRVTLEKSSNSENKGVTSNVEESVKSCISFSATVTTSSFPLTICTAMGVDVNTNSALDSTGVVEINSDVSPTPHATSTYVTNNINNITPQFNSALFDFEFDRDIALNINSIPNLSRPLGSGILPGKSPNSDPEGLYALCIEPLLINKSVMLFCPSKARCEICASEIANIISTHSILNRQSDFVNNVASDEYDLSEEQKKYEKNIDGNYSSSGNKNNSNGNDDSNGNSPYYNHGNCGNKYNDTKINQNSSQKKEVYSINQINSEKGTYSKNNDTFVPDRTAARLAVLDQLRLAPVRLSEVMKNACEGL